MEKQQTLPKFLIMNHLNYKIIQQQIIPCHHQGEKIKQNETKLQNKISQMKNQSQNQNDTHEKIKAHKLQLRKRLGLSIQCKKQIKSEQKLSGDMTASSVTSKLKCKRSYNNLSFEKSISIQNFQDLEKNNVLNFEKLEKIDDYQQIQEEAENDYGKCEEDSTSPQKQNFNSKYKIIKKIGQGAHSVVYKCKSLITNQSFAVKVSTNIQEQIKQMMMRQYKLLKILDHEDVLKVHELIFDQKQKKIYMVSELCQYHDLRHEIVKRKFFNKPFTQKQALQLIHKILQTLQYLQNSGVCHRDIKPQNILYNPKTGESKLIDFDISKQRYSNKQQFSMWTITGSLLYKAPQSFSFGYGQKVDVWSTGIVLYELLQGNVPFNSQYQKDTVKKIKTQKLSFQGLLCSPKTKFLLIKMLEKQAEHRFSCEQALNYLQNEKYQSRVDTKIIEDQKKQLKSQLKLRDTLQKNYFQEQDKSQNNLVYRIKMDFLIWNIKDFN